MATLSGCMAPGWLGWQQGLATWHQGGWDGNRALPNDTRVAGMATGMATWHQGGCDCVKVWPHGTRKAVMATGSSHMAPGRLG